MDILLHFLSLLLLLLLLDIFNPLKPSDTVSKQFGIHASTLLKRMTGKVVSMGCQLGGWRRGRVLTAGEFQPTQLLLRVNYHNQVTQCRKSSYLACILSHVLHQRLSYHPFLSALTLNLCRCRSSFLSTVSFNISISFESFTGSSHFGF